MPWRHAAFASVVMTKCHLHGSGTTRSTARHDVRSSCAQFQCTCFLFHVSMCTASVHTRTPWKLHCLLRLALMYAVNRINEESTVNRSLAGNMQEELMKLVGWAGLDNPWLPETDANVEYSYINLQVNPERYTGYTVSSCRIQSPPDMFHACSCEQSPLTYCAQRTHPYPPCEHASETASSLISSSAWLLNG